MAKDNREAVFVVQRGGTRLYRVVERKENGVIVKDDSGRERFFENGSYEFVHIGTDYAKPGVDLACKIEVDADGAITALKALQREARKATQALRELETVATLHAGEVVIPSARDLEVLAVKRALKDGKKHERHALALIEEQEKMIAELRRLVDELHRES
jgi:hypothetical protein